MSDMVRAWLDHADTLNQDAVPWPWTVGLGTQGLPSDGPTHVEVQSRYGQIAELYLTEVAAANAEWIAHARTALPKAAEALRAVLDLCDQWDTEASELLSGVSGVVSDEALKVRTAITAALCNPCDHEWTEWDE